MLRLIEQALAESYEQGREDEKNPSYEMGVVLFSRRHAEREQKAMDLLDDIRREYKIGNRSQ